MTAASVRAGQRHTKRNRCPICGGADGDPRSKGRRCHGYTSDDGKWAHCSRDEHAGGLPLEDKAKTYAHRIGGPCKCGATHSESDNWNGIEAVYQYRDERGELLFEVVRTADKRFYQRKPDGTKGVNGVRRVPYRLPELLKAPPDAIVYVVEGEKDVDALRSRGAVAVCNPMGAEKWSAIADTARKALAGRHVVIISDDDDTGRAHGADVGLSVAGVAASVRHLRLWPEGQTKRDVSDWLDAGNTVAALADMVASIEPASTTETAADADPFGAELAQARDEVQNALSGTQTKKRAPLFFDALDLMSRVFVAAVWSVVGLLTRGGVGVIGGEPKAIKTWFAAEMAVAVATGTKAFGEFKTEAGIAAYFFAEDLDLQVRNRIRSCLAARDVALEPGRLHVCPRGQFLDVLNDDDLAWIVASCRRLGNVSLLILDPLRDLHSGKENESDDMRDVMRRLRLLGELLGCTVLVVHHTIKQSDATSGRRPGQRMRGSSAIHGSIDGGIYMTEAKGGDGSSRFVNNVVTEIKGARSAAPFGIDLALDDDDDGGAVRATWRVIRTEKTADKADRDLQRVFEWVAKLAAKGIRLTRRKLRERDDRPLSEAKTETALNALIDLNRLELDDDSGAVVLPHTADGKTWNDFAGARGAPRGKTTRGAVGCTSIEVPQHASAEDER